MGFAPADFDDAAEPSARPDFAKALETIRSLGVQVTEVKLPEFPYGPIISTIISSEAASIFEPLIKSGKVDELADPKQIAGLKAGLEIPATDYLKAMRIRSLIQSAFSDLFDKIDVLLAPSRLGPAPKITQPLDRPATPHGAYPSGQPGRPTGSLAAMRLRGRNADRDSTGRPSVYGEHPAGHRQRFSGAHRLASPPPAGR